jgi:hypothetical protein
LLWAFPEKQVSKVLFYVLILEVEILIYSFDVKIRHKMLFIGKFLVVFFQPSQGKILDFIFSFELFLLEDIISFKSHVVHRFFSGDVVLF